MTSSQPLNNNFFQARLNLQLKQWIPLMGGLFLTTSAYAYVLYGFVDHQLLLLWLLLNYVMIVVRVSIAIKNKNKQIEPESERKWQLIVHLPPIISGFINALVPIFFFVPVPEWQVAVMVVILSGMTGGTIASLATFPFAFIGFATLTMGGLAIRLLMEPGEGFLIMGILSIAFLLASIFYCFNIYKTIMESLRVQYENELLLTEVSHQKEQAESANMAKSRFFAAASHDLRQPLHALGLFVSALKENYHKRNEQKDNEIFDMINHSLDSQKELFNSILDLSKLDAGVITVEPKSFYINKVFQELEDEFKALASDKNLSLNVTYDDTVIIHTDELILKRILKNLISNAIKYSTEGTINLGFRTQHTITEIGKKAEIGKVLEIYVSDSGRGIAQEEQDKIFNEFYQINNTDGLAPSDTKQGLGLGLSIVSRLITLLESTIIIESQLNKGSTFQFKIPKGKAQNIDDEIVTQLLPQWDVKSYQFLVIDDDEDILNAMKYQLESWESNVKTFRNHFEAIDCIKNTQYQPDLIFIDYRLENNFKGTIVVHDILKLVQENIPVVVISADTSAQRLEEIQSSGFELLHKPVAPAKLRMCIQRLLK